jgi:cytochrome c peroxidase
LLCKLGASCDPKMVLPLTIARFRTPPLRDLEDSSPFMHTGRFQTIEDVLHYYIRTSELARRGEIRNGAAEIGGITIDENDVAALAAFLRSLNEDYD